MSLRALEALNVPQEVRVFCSDLVTFQVCQSISKVVNLRLPTRSCSLTLRRSNLLPYLLLTQRMADLTILLCLGAVDLVEFLIRQLASYFEHSLIKNSLIFDIVSSRQNVGGGPMTTLTLQFTPGVMLTFISKQLLTSDIMPGVSDGMQCMQALLFGDYGACSLLIWSDPLGLVNEVLGITMNPRAPLLKCGIALILFSYTIPLIMCYSCLPLL